MTTEFNEETFKKETGADYSSWYQLNKRMKAGETLQGDDFKIYTTGLNAVIKLTGQKEITDKVLSLEDTVKSEREEIGQLQDLVLKKEDELVTLQDTTREYEAKIKAYEENPNTGAPSAQVKGLFEEVKDLRAQLDAKTSELEKYEAGTQKQTEDLRRVKEILKEKEEEIKQREKYIQIKEEDIKKVNQDLVDKIELIERSGNFSKFLVSTADSEKDMPKKVLYYRWALKIDTENTDIWSKLGYAFIDSEQFGLALACAKDILELDKENEEAYKIKANVLLKTAKTESDLGEALENFLKVVEKRANDAISYAHISWLTYKLGNLKDAVDNYDKALGLDHHILDKVPVNTHVTTFKSFEELNPQKYEAIRKGPIAVSTGPVSALAPKPFVVKHKQVVKKVRPRPSVQPPVKPEVSSPPAPPVQKPQDLEGELVDIDLDEEPVKKPDDDENKGTFELAKKIDYASKEPIEKQLKKLGIMREAAALQTESAEQEKPEPKEEEGDNDAAQYDCPECGAIIGEDDKKCPECGSVQYECPLCGAIIGEDNKKCSECGAEFE